MKREQTRADTRGWIMMNYASAFLAVLLPLLIRQLGLGLGWSGALLAFVVAALAFSHHRAFVRTGMWTLTHAKPRTLDERERELAHEALAGSYTWITVVLLFAMYLIILANDAAAGAYLGWVKPIAPVLAIALIYVAHSLPAAIIGWIQLPAAEGIQGSAGSGVDRGGSE